MPTRFDRRYATTENRGRVRTAGINKTDPSTPRLRRVRDEIDNTKKMLKTEFYNLFFSQLAHQRITQHNKPGIKTKGKYPIFFTQITPKPTYSSLITPNFPLSASPFGVVLQEREFSSSSYRHGFNGMERDDEVKGSGNSYDFGARMYDSRLGRWLSVDPLSGEFTSFSPYSFVVNMPTIAIDPDGKKISFEGLTRKEKREFKSAIKVLMKSEIFKQMYSELEASKTVVTLKSFKMDPNSTNILERAGGYAKKETDGKVSVGWGDGQLSTLAQEMFHSYQYIAENEELYKDMTVTDREVEGEVATFHIMEEVFPGKREYIPMGGYKLGEVDSKTKKAEMIFSDVFKQSPLDSKTVNSQEFDNAYQKYKGEMVSSKKMEKAMGMPIPSNYTGPVTKAKAEGLKKLVTNKETNKKS